MTPVRLSDVLAEITSNLSRFDQHKKVCIGVVASVNMGLIEPLMKRYASTAGIDLTVRSGTFDNPVEDVVELSKSGMDYVLFVPFVESSVPDASIRLMGTDSIEAEELIDSFVARWTAAASSIPPNAELMCCLPDFLVKPSASGPRVGLETGMTRLRSRLVESLSAVRPTSFIDTTAIIASLGASTALDLRMFFRGKAPYSLPFLDELARLVNIQTRQFGSRFPKALVVDCDNTLWGGIVGEDGIPGIQLDAFDFPGNVFWRVQSCLKDLQGKGVLLCLATKNEPADIDEVFRSHDSMLLSLDDFVATRVSWEDKATMIRSIAEELNIGMESIAFLDDSDFELESVANQLPEVVVFKAPTSVVEYPKVLEEIVTHFRPVLSATSGSSKTEEYRTRSRQLRERSNFGSHQEYLGSLGIELRIVRSEVSRIPRLSELTMKTNQFNLTTWRITEEEMRAVLSSDSKEVLSCHVSDRFGDHGLTGVVIVESDGVRAEILNMLLSCRILGRGIETAVIATLTNWLFDKGHSQVVARRISSVKNGQTESFLTSSGFVQIDADEGSSKWSLSATGNLPVVPDWITVKFDGQ